MRAIRQRYAIPLDVILARRAKLASAREYRDNIERLWRYLKAFGTNY